MRKIILFTAIPVLCAVAIAGPGLTRGGYESPDYEVTDKYDEFEVRNYPEMRVVSTRMEAAADKEQQDQRFMRLFERKSGGNVAGVGDAKAG